MTDQQQTPIAISYVEYDQFGCPYCGYRSGYTPISCNGTSIFVCGECRRSSAFLAEGVQQSTIGFGDFRPMLQAHPRAGIPKHGKPDKQPETGGEFFRSRGIGLDSCTCLACNTHDRDGKGHVMLNNIAAFVQCKAAGERVVAMFKQGARLDYREHEPDRVQIKIGACDQHLHNLEKLDQLCSDGIITQEKVNEALQ